jgi:hypothetical protein
MLIVGIFLPRCISKSETSAPLDPDYLNIYPLRPHSGRGRRADRNPEFTLAAPDTEFRVRRFTSRRPGMTAF